MLIQPCDNPTDTSQPFDSITELKLIPRPLRGMLFRMSFRCRLP
jgi:hypothetical protein